MAEDDEERMGPNGIVIDRIMAVAEDYPRKEPRRGRKKKAFGPYGDIESRGCQKRRGEIGEAMFLAKAARMGFGIATPWGDSLKYDMVIDTGKRLFRVQVKSAHKVSASKGGGYHLRACSHNRRAYRAKDIDLLVGYVLPLDAWYLFPPRAFVRMKSMRLFPVPGKKKSKFEAYREAWECFEEEVVPLLKNKKSLTQRTRGSTG
jgi:PD-(D/E)XK endonuclease